MSEMEARMSDWADSGQVDETAPPESHAERVPAARRRNGLGQGLRDFRSWVPLSFLVFVFLPPAFGDLGTGAWLIAAGLVLVHLPLHFLSVGASGRRLLWLIAGMGSLGVVGLGFGLNAGASVFLIYAAALSARVGGVRQAVALIVALCVCALACGALLWPSMPGEWLIACLPALVLVPAVGAFAVLDVEKERTNARLLLAHDEVERLAAVAERERIARDMHDLLGHTLTMIALKADLAAKLANKEPTTAATEMGEVAAASRDALADVREAVRGFRSKGLNGEIEVARRALQTAGIAFQVQFDSFDLPRRLEGVLALAVRESVTNVIRHSGASTVWVSLSRSHNGVTLTFIDDGNGGGVEGNGLAGIRERVEALGGSFAREQGGVGTAINLRLPAERSRA